jgi:DNA-binding GntR family transcriptional regulator
VGLRDVAVALRQLEPACAAMCAERPERRETVLPRLRAIQDQVRAAAVDDQIAFTVAARAFHEAIVAGCGNETMRLIVGALESIWSARERDWARRALDAGDFPANETRLEGVRAHDRLIELIERGDATGVARAARTHLDRTQTYAVEGSERPVQAAAVRGG